MSRGTIRAGPRVEYGGLARDTTHIMPEWSWQEDGRKGVGQVTEEINSTLS